MTAQWVYVHRIGGVITSASDLVVSLPCASITNGREALVLVPGWVAHSRNAKRVRETVVRHLAALKEWRPRLPCTVTLTLCAPRPPRDVERLLAPTAHTVRAWAGWDDDADVSWSYAKRTDRAAGHVMIEIKGE